MTSTKDSLSPIIADLVPGHNQIFKFDGSSRSTSIDVNKVFAGKLIGEALAKQRAFWVEGKDGKVALSEIINEKKLIVDHVSDDDIAVLVDKYTNLCSFYGMENSHKAMIVHDDGRNICLAFTCTQIASAIASPANAHRLGNCAIGFFHEWIRAFLVFAGAPRHNIFPPFSSTKESLLHSLLTKSGSSEIT
jgi:hypothetical protein